MVEAQQRVYITFTFSRWAYIEGLSFYLQANVVWTLTAAVITHIPLKAAGSHANKELPLRSRHHARLRNFEVGEEQLKRKRLQDLW